MRALLVSGLACLFPAGCAEGSHVDKMVAATSAPVAATSPLNHAVRVVKVSGGSKTNPLWTSQVADGDFRKPLEGSLSQSGMPSADNARDRLDAILTELKSP